MCAQIVIVHAGLSQATISQMTSTSNAHGKIGLGEIVNSECPALWQVDRLYANGRESIDLRGSKVHKSTALSNGE